MRCAGVGLVLSAAGLSGCSSVGLGYLLQAGRGQLELANRARPISEVIRDERTPPRIRRLLERIPEVKKFGEENGIKPTRNYTEFVKLDRDAAVWVVSASESLRFKAKKWEFPIVGSFPYLGWFEREDAARYAEELRSKEGLDVDLRGASAYSTLGWFRDAVLSTMIPSGRNEPAALGSLVNVVLHESVHATIYVNDQSYFNESIASFAADRLADTYLEKTQGPGSPELEAYRSRMRAAERRDRDYQEAYFRLEKLYASDLDEDQKKVRKAAILAELKSKVGASREINNATLIQYRTYGVGMNEFAELLKACDSDWSRFWKSLEGWARADRFSKPQQEDLASVIPRSC